MKAGRNFEFQNFSRFGVEGHARRSLIRLSDEIRKVSLEGPESVSSPATVREPVLPRLGMAGRCLGFGSAGQFMGERTGRQVKNAVDGRFADACSLPAPTHLWGETTMIAVVAVEIAADKKG
jgi:hypothetical protein